MIKSVFKTLFLLDVISLGIFSYQTEVVTATESVSEFSGGWN
ncbi:hypothetical protein [Enterococcus mundtii]|nr:hypothetical protein [Enterococcus mundtii]